MEWVVVYWLPDRREQRFKGDEQDRAIRYAMLLPASTKIYVDHVNFGDEVRVR
jgi:hypothetical protein